MKKIYLVTILVAFVSFAFAQKTTTGSANMQKPVFSTVKTPTDTIMPGSCVTGSPSLYNAQGGGYVCGNNGYGDLAKAQAFIVTETTIVEGCMFWIGAKEQIGTAGTVNVNLYNMNGTGTTAAGSGPCPGTILATVPLAMDVIDTGLMMVNGLNFVTFPTPTPVGIEFAIGLDFAAIGNDTIGIVSTTDGDAAQIEQTWEKWSTAAWHSLLEAWPLDFDMYIFAILDNSSAGIESNNYFDGIKLSQNQPNPAVATTLIQYAIENSGNVSLEIYDVTGRLVLTLNQGQQSAGTHSILVDSEQLSKGTYYYSLKADKHRLTKKMVITQ
jgi:hypothetical protein